MATGNGFHEVVPGRLYTIPRSKLQVIESAKATIFIDLSDVEMTLELGDTFYISWPVGSVADQKLFSALVVFCSMAMKSPEQRVLITGSQETIDVTATCILREYMGIDANMALGIMRQGRKSAVTRSDLIETVMLYKPT